MNLIEFKQKNAGVSVKPILFSTEMVQAILEGRKTHTRRVVKPQPEQTRAKGKAVLNVSDYFTGCPEKGKAYYWKNVGVWNSSEPFHCPYGKPGDILWVRETFAKLINGHNEIFYTYYAEDPTQGDYIENWQGWKPSIHMPFEAARIFLRIKSVRVERLNDISEEDAKSEGVKLHESGKSYLNYMDERSKVTQFIYNCHTAVHSFRTLWGEINGHHGPLSYYANPWVWVVEFEIIDINK